MAELKRIESICDPRVAVRIFAALHASYNHWQLALVVVNFLFYLNFALLPDSWLVSC